MESEDELDLTDPPAGGQRLHWHQLPEDLRQAIEAGIRSSVVEAKTQPGGFSPGVAARLRLDDGRRIFMKVVGSHPNPSSPELHRREAKIATALPPYAPAPRLLWSYDDGDWVALGFEDINGRTPKMPWLKDELTRVLATIEQLARSLTPSPLATAPSLKTSMEDVFKGWRTLSGGPLPDRLDDWTKANLDRLVLLENLWKVAAEGNTLLHVDIRADNLLLTEDKVFVVDWPHAANGADWADLLFMLPSVYMQGGPPPWAVFD
ncbi:MAG: phosphotransferase, partial [Acidimicrobiia bacterium]